MASKIKTAEIKSFVGGINTFASATQVKDGETPDMLNIAFTGTSAITKRSGFTKLTSEVSNGHKIQGIFVYQTNTVKEILYVSYVFSTNTWFGWFNPDTGGTFSSRIRKRLSLGDNYISLMDRLTRYIRHSISVRSDFCQPILSND